MSAIRHILRQGLPMAAGTAVQLAAAFGGNLVLARHLLPAEFGRFALVQASAGLVLSVISLRLNTVIIRMPQAEMTLEAQRRLFTLAVVENLAALVLMMAWVVVVGGLEIWDYTLIVAILLAHWLGVNRTFFERHQKFHGLTALETAVQVSGHLGSIALVMAGMGAETLYLRELYFVGAATAGLTWMGGLRLYRPIRLRWSDVTALYRDIRGLWLDGMLEGSFQRLTLVAVNAATSLTGTGLFFQAQRLAVIPHQFVNPVIGRILASWVGATESIQLRRATRHRILLLLGGPLVLAAGATFLFADPVVPWIFGPNWASAAPVLQSLAGMIIFLSLFEALRCFAVMTKRVRLLLLARIAQYLGLGLPLAPLLWGKEIAIETMGLSLSLAYGLAFLVLLLSLRFNERNA